VRYIGNRSSGKMGYALAEEAMRLGARVILVTGPTALNAPNGSDVILVQTAEEMRSAVVSRLGEATMVIKAAAVADYRPKQAAAQKIKGKNAITLELEPTTDIAAEVSRLRKEQIVIGFAAETENVMTNARRKLAAKALDAIVVNDVSDPKIGFDSDRNAVTILTADDNIQVPEAGKHEIALVILRFAATLKQRRASHSTR
jgi:phosphopantothenoylcysteine decarboxylase/phosphopantothenate--cysteine ligase